MDADVTRAFITNNNIVAIKADKTTDSPDIDALLVKLGNHAKAIPFYAIYPAGQPDKPIVLDGVFASPDRVMEALRKAVQNTPTAAAASSNTPGSYPPPPQGLAP